VTTNGLGRWGYEVKLESFRTACQGNRAGWGLRLVAAVVPVSVVVCLAVAAPAGAEDIPVLPVQITVVNETTAPDADVTIVTGGTEKCWNDGDLVAVGNKAAYRWIAPGQRSTFFSSRSNSVFRGCMSGFFTGERDGFRQLQMAVRDSPQSSSYVPQGEGLMTLHADPVNSGGGGVRVLDGVPTWVPRRDGYGLICFRDWVQYRWGGDDPGLQRRPLQRVHGYDTASPLAARRVDEAAR
jgi:hypothetical protein